jgi:CheY-like chemotaxis protein
MRQILINLLSNAVKFTATGEVLLTVSAAPAAPGQLEVTIKVTDTGIGIPAEALPGLFTSFSQVDATNTRTQGGTGLGLTISQRLARAMGGDVSVASVAGEGSTFTATMIVDECAGTAAENRRRPDEVDLSGRSVLVVDDNHTNLRILSLQLTRLGIRCTAVSQPAEALRLVAEGLTYDLAIIDLHMPEMDGMELTAALREMPSVADAPAILLSSMGSRPVGTCSIFAAVLAKPVKGAVLRDAVAKALARELDSESSGRTRREPLVPAMQPLRILLAEDNPVNQRVAQLLLAKLGHSVDTVPNGRDAVDAVTTVDYDVVLMDVQMPEMDGLEATRIIRAQPRSQRQPYIIAMTANAMVEDRDACSAAGMEGYLSKPVRAKELKQLLSGLSTSLAGSSTN